MQFKAHVSKATHLFASIYQDTEAQTLYLV